MQRAVIGLALVAALTACALGLETMKILEGLL